MTSPAIGSAFPLFRAYPRLQRHIPLIQLSLGASPVSRLDQLTAHLRGPEIWIKNDGLYGTIYGGNKPRKLEFILGDALRKRSPALLTTGALATNHGLATALYGRQVGLKVGLLLTYEEPQPDTCEQLRRMQAAGADLHYTRSLPWTLFSAPYFALRYREGGRWPYLLMSGGSTPLGALGYVNAGFELARQVQEGELPEPRTIILPLGSGGTAAGLLLGLRLAGLDSQLLAIAVTRAPTAWKAAVVRLARSAARLLARETGDADIARVQLSGLSVRRNWLGPGFGRESALGEQATRIVAELEGLRLEGSYTAKAMSALVALASAGDLTGNVLYWHTYNAIPLPEVVGAPGGLDLPKPFRRFCI